MANGSPIDQELIVNNNDGFSTAKKNTVNVQTLDRCFIDRIDNEMSISVAMVEDRIQDAIFTAIDIIFTPRIELAVRALNAPSERDAASFSANSERGERIGVTASFENVFERNNTFHEININDETRGKVPDEEASELSVPWTLFDRHSHTHHRHYWLFFGKKPAIFSNFFKSDLQ